MDYEIYGLPVNPDKHSVTTILQDKGRIISRINKISDNFPSIISKVDNDSTDKEGRQSNEVHKILNTTIHVYTNNNNTKGLPSDGETVNRKHKSLFKTEFLIKRTITISVKSR